MRMSKLIGRCIKEDPRDAQIISHKFILRGGYARMVSAGIYSMLALGHRVTKKIEKIIQNIKHPFTSFHNSYIQKYKKNC